MELLTGLFRPHPRWLILLALLPFLAGEVASAGDPAVVGRVAVVAPCAPAIAIATDQVAAMPVDADVPTSRIAVASGSGPRLHACDRRRSRAPPG